MHRASGRLSTHGRSCQAATRACRARAETPAAHRPQALNRNRRHGVRRRRPAGCGRSCKNQSGGNQKAAVIRRALLKRHVRNHVRARRDVLLAHETARNPRRLARLRDQSDNIAGAVKAASAPIHGVSEICHEVLLSTITQTAMRGPFGVCRHTNCPSSKLRPRARHVQFGSARAAKSNALTAANVAKITAPARRFRSKLFIVTTLHNLVTHGSRCRAHSGPASNTAARSRRKTI